MSARSLVRELTPPLVWRQLKRGADAVRGRKPEYEYQPQGWEAERSDPEIKGWYVDRMREVYSAGWPRWVESVQGPGPLGVDFIRSLRQDEEGAFATMPKRDFAWAHNAVATLGYVLALVADGRRELTVCEWGGGVGQHQPLVEALLPGVAVDYHVRELPDVCAIGRDLAPRVTFHADDATLQPAYDLVFTSSVLQFVEDWRGFLASMVAHAGHDVYVTRLPIVYRSPSFVVLQRGFGYAFETQFLGWYLNEAEWTAETEKLGLELVREFVMADQTPAHGAPEQASYRGFLYRR